jgi:hypothetical protein
MPSVECKIKQTKNAIINIYLRSSAFICVHLRKSASHLVLARVAELADALDLGSSG